MPTHELAIRCPTTGLPVGTGEATEHRAHSRSTERRIMPRCPACGGSHVWQLREAWMIPETEGDAEPNVDAELL